MSAPGESGIDGLSDGRPAPGHPVLRALALEGVAVEEVRALGNPHSPLIEGYRMTIKGAEIVLRALDGETLMIVLYRRTTRHATLRTAFAGLVWLIEWLRRRDLGVRRLVGVVDTSHYREEGGLPDDRLERFYRLIGGRRITAADVPGLDRPTLRWHGSRQTTWMALDLADFRSPRSRRGAAAPEPLAPAGKRR